MQENFNNKIAELGTKEEMTTLQRTIDNCVTYDHMQELKGIVLPTVAEVKMS
jgi:hypothetical protein